jgi:hypothetical protein
VFDILALAILEAAIVVAALAALAPSGNFGFDFAIPVKIELAVPVATDFAVLDLFVPVALVDTVGIGW